ncbi:MAG: hypothetical protein FWH11_04390 [Micrococcales bacterium]|nr:hypothetical protein [Micrococcales bacterium]
MDIRLVVDDRTTAMVDGVVPRREFVFADCLVVGGRVYEYGWDAERLAVGAELSVGSGEYGLAGFDQLDRLDVGPIAYSCGSTLARGSSGYFMKTVGDQLVWLLVCTDSEAFTAVRRRRDGVEFVAQLGERWVLPAEDVTAVFVEPPGQLADLSWPASTVGTASSVPAPRRSARPTAARTGRTGSAVVW